MPGGRGVSETLSSACPASWLRQGALLRFVGATTTEGSCFCTGAFESPCGGVWIFCSSRANDPNGSLPAFPRSPLSGLRPGVSPPSNQDPSDSGTTVITPAVNLVFETGHGLGRVPVAGLCRTRNSVRPGRPVGSIYLLEPLSPLVSNVCPRLHTTDRSPQQGRSGAHSL